MEHLSEEQFLERELDTRREQGCDTWELERDLDLARKRPPKERGQRFARLRGELEELEPEPDWSYAEPDELDHIRELRPEGPRSLGAGVDARTRRDKVRGAWLGRTAGCLLGKPVEGWNGQHIRDLLRQRDACPLDDYWPMPAGGENVELTREMKRLRRGHIEGAPRDDDMDYTVLALRTVEEHGRGFTSRDVAEKWLMDVPAARLFTAERIAYGNFLKGIWPPESARDRNPYREWIGARIRGDLWGYICPGHPEEAAGLAYRDARISHVRNGVYGAMWVAAMNAAAYVTGDPEQLIRIGLSEIPGECRLSEAVEIVLRWRDEGESAERVLERIGWRFGDYEMAHSINNAAIVAAALLWGGGDFTRSVGLAVMGGMDTDCNGATVGSIAGMVAGAETIPSHWVNPLENRLETAVAGEGTVPLSDLAERTFEVSHRDKDGVSCR
ncbi:MAG: ADP-ribosylglycohydrolase family protein [Planctomycetota bacterium]